jgi:hypothetical protein
MPVRPNDSGTQLTSETSTPAALAWRVMARPSGVSGSWEIQVAGVSRQARVAAVFISAPPTVTFNCSDNSSRLLPGGV